MARIVFLCLALVCSCACVAQVKDCRIVEAKKIIGVREGRVNNRGPVVDTIIRYAGGTPGQPWCSYTIIYLWKKCNVYCRRTNGMAMSWAKQERRAMYRDAIKPTTVFTIYNKALGRIGHVGMVYKTYPEEPFFQSFEGNINSRGDRESHRSVAGCLIRQYDVCNGFFNWD